MVTQTVLQEGPVALALGSAVGDSLGKAAVAEPPLLGDDPPELPSSEDPAVLNRAILPPRGHLALSGDTSCCYNREGGGTGT